MAMIGKGAAEGDGGCGQSWGTRRVEKGGRHQTVASTYTFAHIHKLVHESGSTTHRVEKVCPSCTPAAPTCPCFQIGRQIGEILAPKPIILDDSGFLAKSARIVDLAMTACSKEDPKGHSPQQGVHKDAKGASNHVHNG